MALVASLAGNWKSNGSSIAANTNTPVAAECIKIKENNNKNNANRFWLGFVKMYLFWLTG